VRLRYWEEENNKRDASADDDQRRPTRFTLQAETCRIPPG
jgi:hypothetical protein